jgi:hypothetical protein
MRKVSRETVGIVIAALLALLIIYMLVVGDINGFNNTYLK